MTTPWTVEWFTRADGERRISGWSMTAIGGGRVGICPLCFAYVTASERPGELDLTRAHEQWHGRNDFPDPGTDA